MLKIVFDAQLAKKLTDAAYKHVVSNFAAEKTTQRVDEIYKEILTA